MEKIGDSFQQQTKHCRDRVSGKRLDWAAQPPLYKEYPDSAKIELPAFTKPEADSLYSALSTRKSLRKLADKVISLEALSCLLWATNGISRGQRGHLFRTAPSAGALYPIETYLVVNNVEKITSGIYHYHVCGHSLNVLQEGEFGAGTAKAALDQRMCAQAPVVFIWSAIFERSTWKYDQRAYRYIYLDAGHIAENLALAAVTLGLGSCQIAALYDDEVNAIIGVDGQTESTLYMSVVGWPA